MLNISNWKHNIIFSDFNHEHTCILYSFNVSRYLWNVAHWALQHKEEGNKLFSFVLAFSYTSEMLKINPPEFIHAITYTTFKLSEESEPNWAALYGACLFKKWLGNLEMLLTHGPRIWNKTLVLNKSWTHSCLLLLKRAKTWYAMHNSHRCIMVS